MASSSSSSSSSSCQVKHQVFLSFRGADTRQGFTSHLLEALKDKGINVFFDEETLEKGEELSQALLSAIANSHIAIVILSEDYASSKSCLMELSEIMHTQGQIVLPIFYHVNPSDVRHHGGSFKKSFDEHQSKRPLSEVQQWKDDFAKVGKLKGWHIEGGNFDRSEPYYIKVIAEDVIKNLNSKSTSDHEELVGINDQKEMILKLINEENTRVIGIWGMGGIGKTTLAEVVYNEESGKFSHKHFLHNVRDKLERQGMESIRNGLLSKLLKQEVHIDTPLIGSTIIQERLRNQRVFVVLDDVNDSDQINQIGVKHFGDGSKILVTSRDQQILKNVVDKMHKVQKLNNDDSLQLFSRFAFKQLNPTADFRDLSEKFVDYAGGLPLALKVLGASLFGKPRKVWESALDRLKETPNPSILKVLRISFDELDEVDKDIFLDIACFFTWENKDIVAELLSCYAGAEFGISNLVDKCLVDVSPSGQVSMHDLLQEMGRAIVCCEPINDPGSRRRLCSPKEVYQVFKNNTGTESIEGINLDMSQIDALQLSPTIFQRMIHLRVLKIYHSGRSNGTACNKLLLADQDSESFRWDYYIWKFLSSKFKLSNPIIESLPSKLRYLQWDYYPSKSLPSKFNLKNLVKLKFFEGEMEQLWDGDHQDLVNLIEINVRSCKKLRKIPSLSGLVKLEILKCGECLSLEELPNLKHLTSFKLLEHGSNFNLKKFPELPGNTTTGLNLTSTKIEEVPDSIEHYTQLEFLVLSHSKVTKVSSNISKLESLENLALSYCPIKELPLSMGDLHKLRQLDLSGTRIQNLQSSVAKLDALFHLNLSDCPDITELKFGPSSFSSFKCLKELIITDCRSLKSLLDLPPCLEDFSADGCTSLENVSFADQYVSEFGPCDGSKCNNHLSFRQCFNLSQDSFANIMTNAMLTIGSKARQIANEYKQSSEIVDGGKVFRSLPRNGILDKFEHQSMNSSLTLKIHPKRCSGVRFLVFTLCFALYPLHDYDSLPMAVTCQGQLKGKRNEIYKNFAVYDNLSGNAVEEEITMWVLFDKDLIHYDMDYEEASFELHLWPNFDFEDGGIDNFKVEKFGVDVSYLEYTTE